MPVLGQHQSLSDSGLGSLGCFAPVVRQSDALLRLEGSLYLIGSFRQSGTGRQDEGERLEPKICRQCNLSAQHTDHGQGIMIRTLA